MAFGEIKVESLKCEISDHYASKFPIKKRCHDDIVNQFRSFSGFSKEDHLNFWGFERAKRSDEVSIVPRLLAFLFFFRVTYPLHLY